MWTWIWFGVAYCLFVLLIAARLRIRGLEQENHDLWGVVLRGILPSKDAA